MEPLLIGIVGGIASGKSFVSEQLERNGAAVVSADRLAHEVLKLDEVKQQIRDRFGDGVFDASGEIDRPSLGKIVFAATPEGQAELKALEAMTHPRIGVLARDQIAELVQAGAVPAIVLDVPLLVETGWNKFCNSVIFVDAPLEARLARSATRGWSAEEIARREALQAPLAQKRESAQWVVDNSGSADAVRAQVDEIWKNLVSVE